MAADVIPGPSRTDAVAERLDRLMVSSRRDDLDFAWRGWEIGSMVTFTGLYRRN